MNFHLDAEEIEDRYDEDENPTGVRRVLEDGDRLLADAARIWDALGSDKGERLRRMWREELDPSEEGISYVTASQLGRLVELLEGIDTETESSLADASWNVRPELVERVEARAPGLGRVNRLGGGGSEYTIAEPLSGARLLRRFLRDALRLGLDVVIE